jgi:hypothetical protein
VGTTPARLADQSDAGPLELTIWDAASGELKQQFSIGQRQVQGIAIIDDHTLAVAPGEGGLLIFTIDPTELQDVLRRSLTRGFTPTECATYGIDPCPTLEELRGEPTP